MSHALVLALILGGSVAAQPVKPLTLQVRVFHGSQEVTADTRVTVHRAGERGDPVAQTRGRHGRVDLTVPPGIYDVQAIREREGRVLNIRWAERLVVMPYPDEEGRHLEVINFLNGYGALQVRQRGTAALEAAIYAPADHDHPAASPRVEGQDYILFVVLAGKYDVQTRSAGQATWHTQIDVPLDRTRLWFVP